MREDEKKSKGLIVLIVIIALVVVLFAIFTPIGLKHLEENRRCSDIETAKSIANSVLDDAAGGQPTIVVGTPVVANPDTVPKLTTQPYAEGDAVEKGAPFTYYYVKQGNTVAVYIGDDRTYNLINPSQAEQYKSK